MNTKEFNPFDLMATEQEAVKYLFDCLAKDSTGDCEKSPKTSKAFAAAEKKYGKLKAFFLLIKAMSLPVSAQEASA